MNTTAQSDVRKQVRRALLVGSLAVLAGLLLVFLFDLLRRPGAPSIGMLVVGVWFRLPVVVSGLAVLVLSLASWLVLRRKPGMARAAGLARSASMGVGLLLLGVPLGVMLLEGCVYDPIKFTWLIHRVEAASTLEEERAAFVTASRWGDVWELNRLERRYLPARAQQIEGAWVLEIEWLETGWSGKPYRAYRRLLDEANLDVFHEARAARLGHVWQKPPSASEPPPPSR